MYSFSYLVFVLVSASYRAVEAMILSFVAYSSADNTKGAFVKHHHKFLRKIYMYIYIYMKTF